MATASSTTTKASWFSLFFLSNSWGCDVTKCRSSCFDEKTHRVSAAARKTKRTISPPKTLAEVFNDARDDSDEEDEAHVKQRGRRRRPTLKRRKSRKPVEKLSLEEEDGKKSTDGGVEAADSEDEQLGGFCAGDCVCFSPMDRKIIVRQDTPAEKRRRRKMSMKPLPQTWMDVRMCMPLTSSDSKPAVDHRRLFRKDVAQLCKEGSSQFCRQDEKGRTLLWIAVRENDSIGVAALFDAAIYAFDPETVHEWAQLADTNLQLTPAELAEEQGNYDLAELVEQKLEASVNIHALKSGWSSGPGTPAGSLFLKNAWKKTVGSSPVKTLRKDGQTKQHTYLRKGSAPPILKKHAPGGVLRSQTAPL